MRQSLLDIYDNKNQKCYFKLGPQIMKNHTHTQLHRQGFAYDSHVYMHAHTIKKENSFSKSVH